MKMFETFDRVGGYYTDANHPASTCGFRDAADRRFWLAWSTTAADDEVTHGVMDDFGSLVET